MVNLGDQELSGQFREGRESVPGSQSGVPMNEISLPTESNLPIEYWNSLDAFTRPEVLEVIANRTNIGDWSGHFDVLAQMLGSLLSLGTESTKTVRINDVEVLESHADGAKSVVESHDLDDLVDDPMWLRAIRAPLTHKLNLLISETNLRPKDQVIEETYDSVRALIISAPDKLVALRDANPRVKAEVSEANVEELRQMVGRIMSGQDMILEKVSDLGNPANTVFYKQAFLGLVITGLILTESRYVTLARQNYSPAINQTLLVQAFSSITAFSDPEIKGRINLEELPKPFTCAINSSAQMLFAALERNVQINSRFINLTDILLGVSMFEFNFPEERDAGIKFYEWSADDERYEQALPTVKQYRDYLNNSWALTKELIQNSGIDPVQNKHYYLKLMQIAVLHRLMSRGMGQFSYSHFYKQRNADPSDPERPKTDPQLDYTKLQLTYEAIVIEMLDLGWVKEADIKRALALFEKLAYSYQQLVIKSQMEKGYNTNNGLGR